MKVRSEYALLIVYDTHASHSKAPLMNRHNTERPGKVYGVNPSKLPKMKIESVSRLDWVRQELTVKCSDCIGN